MGEEQPKLSRIVILLYLGMAGAILYTSFATQGSATKHVSYSEFMTAVQDGQVETVRIANTELTGTLKKTDKTPAASTVNTARVPAMDESWLMKELRDNNVQII